MFMLESRKVDKKFGTNINLMYNDLLNKNVIEWI